MPSRSGPDPQLPLRWRVAAFSLVFLAIALAGAGMWVVQHRMNSLSESVLEQAAMWAYRAAAEAPPSFDQPRIPAFQRTDDFLEEHNRTLLAYTLLYVGLTFAALAALVLAMWILLRLVRREMALAELKANFVADVSHELKTPLALIRLYAETLQSGRVPSDEKRGDYLNIILRESTRLTNLINNILDFARIDAGRKEYQLQPTNVVEVIRQTYDSYRPQLDHMGFTHRLTVDEPLPRVDADADAIAQILINLVNNAVKYSDEEKYLAIELTPDTRRDRRGVLISVHDRGIGILPEDRARLTEGFFRASDPRVREQSGTGLGLALVRHIVDAHQGSLDIESRLVKGTTFRVFLPASVESEASAEI